MDISCCSHGTDTAAVLCCSNSRKKHKRLLERWQKKIENKCEKEKFYVCENCTVYTLVFFTHLNWWMAHFVEICYNRPCYVIAFFRPVFGMRVHSINIVPSKFNEKKHHKNTFLHTMLILWNREKFDFRWGSYENLYIDICENLCKLIYICLECRQFSCASWQWA